MRQQINPKVIEFRFQKQLVEYSLLLGGVIIFTISVIVRALNIYTILVIIVAWAYITDRYSRKFQSLEDKLGNFEDKKSRAAEG